MASHSNNQHTGVLVGQLNYKTNNNIGIMTAIKLTWDDWKKENIEITLISSIKSIITKSNREINKDAKE